VSRYSLLRGGPRASAVALACVALLATVAGCGAGGTTTTTTTTASEPQRPQGVERSSSREHRKEPSLEKVVASHCPPELPSCRTTEGRIVYVERVDPDGDGDAHFVVIDLQSITLPGLTAIDVRKGLRPHPLPGIGGLISAAGPVETGSHGQSQIHALELHVAGD
jgi:hypothetical protein